MNNKDKVILDLSGGTGAWSKFYNENGYTVYIVTLPGFDIFNIHFRCDNNLTIVGNEGYETFSIPYEKIYGILFAPVCTDFSLARTTAKTPRDLERGMRLVKQGLHIIWNCRYRNKLAFWALENPTGYLRQFLGRPALTFNPCDYGDPYTKRTDLFGYFNIPKRNPIKLNAEQRARCAINNRKLPVDIKGTAARRAITPAGFAKAFFLANQ